MVNVNEEFEDINMQEAPETASFTYKGKLEIEEWVRLPLEKRARGEYVKPDVPYYHVAFRPLSYRISDGGMEGDGLEHTYVAIKNAQGELTPKGSARDELVKAFTARGFPRNTIHDLTNKSAIGKVFLVKRYNRTYARGEGKEPIRGELMNVPMDVLPDDWAPAPGTTIPEFSRKPRPRDGAGSGVTSGGVAKPIGVTPNVVAEAMANAGVSFTEEAAKAFILDRADLAQGEILDAALGKTLLSELAEKGLVTNVEGKVALA